VFFSKEDSLSLRIFRGVGFSVSIRPAREGGVERVVKEYVNDWTASAYVICQTML
jgi:hypothetical protein